MHTNQSDRDRYIHTYECGETCICIVRLKPNTTAATEKDGLGFRQSCDLRFYISILGSPSTANEQVLADDTILVCDGLKWTTTFWRSYLRVYVAALLLSSIPTLSGSSLLRAVGSPWWFPLGKLARSPLLEITLSIVEECAWTVNKSVCTWCWQHTTRLKRTFPPHVKLLFTYTLMLLARFPGCEKACTCNVMLCSFPFEWLF